MDNNYFRWRNAVRGELLCHYRLWSTDALVEELALAERTRDAMIRNYQRLDQIDKRLDQLREVVNWRKTEAENCPCDDVTYWLEEG